MQDGTGEVAVPGERVRSRGPLKTLWRKVRKPIADSPVTKSALASILANVLRFIRLTNRLAPESDDIATAHAKYSPTIIAFWHGQHLLAPVVYPRNSRLVAMVSRSADAELNALVVEKFGLETVRGSGGRQDTQHLDKGGAKALIALKKALDAGANVCMIADIPHGTPRDAGLGIVTLARLSKKPIVPVAIATSRRKVLERTWDKTTIGLPFGRLAVTIGEPVYVPANADMAMLEAKRQEVTASLNEATERAYRIVDTPR